MMILSHKVAKSRNGFCLLGFLAVSSALLICQQAYAKTWTLKDGGTNASGLRNCTWTDSDGNTSTVLNAEDDYVTASKIYVTSVSVNQDSLNTFTGKSLRIGTVGSGKRVDLYYYGRKAWFENDGLELANGHLLVRYPSKDNYMHLYGRIAVTASKTVPFIIDHIVDNVKNFDADTLHFDGPLSGNGHILIRPIGFNDKSYGRVGVLNLSIDGGASEFTGGIRLESVHLRVDPNFDWSGALCQAGLILPSGSMPASVEVGTNSILQSAAQSGVTTIRSLDIGNEAELKFKMVLANADNADVYVTNASIRVTESFSMSGKIMVTIEEGGYDFKSGVPALRLGLLTVPGNSDIAADDFELSENSSLTRFSKLEIEEDQDTGTKTLVLTREAVVALLKEDASNVVQSDEGSVAVTNESYWSDGSAPHDNANYCLAAKVFRTPWNPEGTCRLEGTSWLLTSSELCVLSSVLEVENLVVMPGRATYITCQYTTRPTSLKSRVFLDDATLRICAYAKGEFFIDGEISGNGTISCEGNNRGSGNPGGYYWLKGLNTNYSGRVVLTMEQVEGRPISFEETKGTKRFNSLYVSDARNLGGAMTPADPKGVVVENMSRVQALETMEFNEPTRGFYIGWIGRIDVAPNKTVTLKNPLAVNGTLWKENSGCLALGNETVRFGSSAMDELPPSDSTNHMFMVAGGSVKPLTAGCMDGLDVVVSNDTCFVFDVNPQDEALRRYGIRNVKTEAPFSCGVGTDAIRVGFDGLPPAASTFTNGLFTVRNGDIARGLLNKIKLIRPENLRYAIKILELPGSEAEHRTLAAEFRKVGLIVSIR